MYTIESNTILANSASAYIHVEGQKYVKVVTSKKKGEGVFSHAYMVECEKKNGYTMEKSLVFGNGYTRLNYKLMGRVTYKAMIELHTDTLNNMYTCDEIVEKVLAKIAA